MLVAAEVQLMLTVVVVTALVVLAAVVPAVDLE
jgi:hypothetical protein